MQHNIFDAFFNLNKNTIYLFKKCKLKIYCHASDAPCTCTHIKSDKTGFVVTREKEKEVRGGEKLICTKYCCENVN